MTRTEPFDIVYDPEVFEHLTAIERAQHAAIQMAIEASLRHQPGVSSRNRKPLRRLARWPGAWELRCGARNRCRVFYRVDETHRRVMVLAVGVKDRSVLRIGGEEISL